MIRSLAIEDRVGVCDIDSVWVVEDEMVLRFSETAAKDAVVRR